MTYRMEDLEFRDRMKRSYTIALLVSVNLQKMLAMIRTALVFREQHRLYARGPILVATAAFLYGRKYGHWECGAIDQIPPPDNAATAAEVKARPDLKEQLNELQQCA